MDPHVHPYPEAWCLSDLTPATSNIWAPKFNIALGRNWKSGLLIGLPLYVFLPGWFIPSITLDVTSPIGYSFFIISLGAEPTTRWLGDGMTEKQIQEREESIAKSGVKPPMNNSYGKKRIHVSEETMTHGNIYDRFVKSLKPNTMASRAG